MIEEVGREMDVKDIDAFWLHYSSTLCIFYFLYLFTSKVSTLSFKSRMAWAVRQCQTRLYQLLNTSAVPHLYTERATPQ